MFSFEFQLKEEYNVIRNKKGVMMMSTDLLKRMREDKGFIAALDQSGGSTPKALKTYGIEEDRYSNEEEMFALVHEMRSRIITDPAFSADKIIGAILFEVTMDSKIDGKYTADYLLEKNILPFLKVDKGLEEEKNGVQLMKPIPELDKLLKHANKHHIFGTKMRSNILSLNEEGIHDVVHQQFDIARQIIDAGLVPIIEPEVNIHAENKAEIEEVLIKELKKHLDQLDPKDLVMLKVTLPEKADAYLDIAKHPNMVRVVALSGGYPLEEANEKLSQNHDMIASFSRALSNDLRESQSDEEFHKILSQAIDSIYDASVNKK